MRKFSFIAVLFLIVLIAACTEKYPADLTSADTETVSGCVSCHNNEPLLKEVADPLPPDPGSSGEG